MNDLKNLTQKTSLSKVLVQTSESCFIGVHFICPLFNNVAFVDCTSKTYMKTTKVTFFTTKNVFLISRICSKDFSEIHELSQKACLQRK